MSKNDALDLLGTALRVALNHSRTTIGPEVAEYVPVFTRGVELLTRLIRERGHRETLQLLDMLAMMPPEKL